MGRGFEIQWLDEQELQYVTVWEAAVPNTAMHGSLKKGIACSKKTSSFCSSIPPIWLCSATQRVDLRSTISKKSHGRVQSALTAAADATSSSTTCLSRGTKSWVLRFNHVRHAALTLQILQQASSDTVHLLQARIGAAAIVNEGVSTPFRSQATHMAAPAAGALLKVALSENPAAHYKAKWVSDLEPLLRGGVDPASESVADGNGTFGSFKCANAVLRPCLSPEPEGDPLSIPHGGGSVGCILVTGGLGGLGLLTGLWAVAQSSQATALLLGRSGHTKHLSRSSLFRLQNSDGVVSTGRCDAGDSAEMDAAIHALLRDGEGRPASHVVHASGAVQDALFARQTAQSLRTVFAPKVAAWEKMQSALACSPVLRPILFSSIAGTLGSIGQASYAAANAVLDALASCHSQQVALPLSQLLVSSAGD